MYQTIRVHVDASCEHDTRPVGAAAAGIAWTAVVLQSRCAHPVVPSQDGDGACAA